MPSAKKAPNKKNYKTIDGKNYLNGDLSLPKGNAQFDFTQDQIIELHKCRDDIIHFAENYFFINTIDHGNIKIKLYDFQKKVLKNWADPTHRFNLLCTSRQLGKALDLDTPIPTPNGYVRMGDLKEGDMVFGINGKPCKVTHAWETLHDRDCYEITFSTGEKIVADGNHNWFTQTVSERHKGIKGSVKTTDEIIKKLKYGNTDKACSYHRIPIANGVDYGEKVLEIEPYILGLWLGDGAKSASRLTIGKNDFVEMLELISEQYTNISYNTDKNQNYRLDLKKEHNTSFVHKLKKLNVYENKHIPDEYLFSSKDQRLELLRGLMDTDGYIMPEGTCIYYTTDEKLKDGVQQLITSLGIQNNISSKIGKIKGKEYKRVYAISFTTDLNICKLERKKERLQKNIDKSKRRNNWIYITDIQKVESRPVRCITVDSDDSLFLCGKTHIPTHNTTITTIIALWLSFFSENPQKIYILANKEDTAKGILDRIKLAYRNMPNWIKAGVEEYTKTNIVFSNESTIKIAPTSTDAIRGVSASCILLDEMAFIRPEIQKAFFESVMPTMSSSKTAKIIAVSTPNGVLNSDGSINSFYLYYSKAELGEGHKEWNGWYSDRAMWYEVPGRDEEWKVQQLRTLNNDYNKWRQEFCCEFLESGAAVLGTDILDRMKKSIRKPVAVFEDGAYRIFKFPQKNHIYVFGVDTSEGVGQDASVAVVLDITDLTHIEMVAEYWTNTTSPYSFAAVLNKIIKNWNYPYLAIERNQTGGQVIDALYNVHHYHNIIHYSMENDKRGFYQNLGIFCHQNSKYTGILNMRYWLDTLEALDIPDLAMLQEFETFVRRPNGMWGAQKGFHDDRIMALIWALIVLETKICERYYEILSYDDIGKPSQIRDPNHVYGQEFQPFESEFTGLHAPPPTYFMSYSMPNPDAHNEFAELQEKGWRRV